MCEVEVVVKRAPLTNNSCDHQDREHITLGIPLIMGSGPFVVGLVNRKYTGSNAWCTSEIFQCVIEVSLMCN